MLQARITSSVNIKYFISVDIQQEMRASFENKAKQSNKAQLLMYAAARDGKDASESAYQLD